MRSLLWFLLLLSQSLGQTVASSNAISPTIAHLKEHLKASNEGVEELWAKAKRDGLPLIENNPADPNWSLVTFLWRGTPDAQNVVVISPLALISLDDARMERISRTDLWFKTYRMRNDARMTYRFAVNDSLVPFEQETHFFERMRSWKTDPLNPRTFEVGEGVVASVVELPQAPSDRWTRKSDEVPIGEMKKDEFQSERLKNTRTVWIYKPANFRPDQAYPLVVVMDGENYTSLVPLPAILDNLIAKRAIPPVVAIFVGNGPGDSRDREMNCTRAWGDFLADDLIPWIKKQGIDADNHDILLIGDSLTGLAAACAAYDHAQLFTKVITQSGSYYRSPEGEEPEWLARHLASGKAIPTQFYLEIGLLETAPIPSRDPSMLTANRHVRDVLVAKGNVVHYVEHFSGHEHVSWRATIAEGLIAMLN